MLRLMQLVAPETPLARLGAVGVTALVATLSLMPNISVPDSAPKDTDLAIHLVMQGTLGFALVWAWPRRLGWVALALACLVVGLETGQIWVSGRSFSWADLITNAVGASLGAGLAYLLAFRVARA